jgi:hypothetical protein
MVYSVIGSCFPDDQDSAVFQLLFQKRVEAKVKLVKVRNNSRFLRKVPGVVVSAIMDDSGTTHLYQQTYMIACFRTREQTGCQILG